MKVGIDINILHSLVYLIIIIMRNANLHLKATFIFVLLNTGHVILRVLFFKKSPNFSCSSC